MLQTVRQSRRWISFAYNPSDATPRDTTTTIPIHNESKPPEPLSHVIPGVSTPPHQRPDPLLDVVNAGPGAVVLARLPPQSTLYVRPGCTIGHAGIQLDQHVQNPWSVLWFIGRPLAGASFFIHKYSARDKDASVMIAPRALGDVALLHCANNSELYVTRRAQIIAHGEGVHADIVRPLLGLRRGWMSRVTGTGSLVLSSFGGLYRIGLGEGEVYALDPDRVVAWNAQVESKPEDDVVHVPKWMQTRVQAVNTAVEWMVQGVHVVRKAVWGSRDMTTFMGPGDVFIASRMPPSLWQKAMTMEPSTWFPKRQVVQRDQPGITGGLHVQHSHASTNPNTMQKRTFIS